MEALNRPIVHWYVAVLTAVACGTLLLGDWTMPSDVAALRNAVAAFFVLGLLSEAGFFRIGIVGVTSSVAFVPFLACVLLVTPGWAMLVAGLTELAAETAIRRKPLIKILHNSSKEIIAVGASGSVYAALGGVPSLSNFSLNAIAFVAAVAVYFAVSEGAPAIAVSLSTRAKLRDTWRDLVGSSLLFDLVSGSIGVLLAWFYVRLDIIGILVVTVPLFFVRHVYRINIRLEQASTDLLELMVKAIEARDPYTSGHSLRVSKIARALARELGLSHKEVDEVATAALLHDVGKIYEEFAPLLRKDGKLLPHEQRLMQSHPVRSAELVRTISTLRGAVELAVRHHHESFDGGGYPDGLAGDQIPIASRIISIADTVDAMTTDRPYRDALPYERVTVELQVFRGRQFDPRIVDVFCNSPRIQMLVGAYLRRPEPIRPKTVAETFDDLRRALGSNS